MQIVIVGVSVVALGLRPERLAALGLDSGLAERLAALELGLGCLWALP